MLTPPHSSCVIWRKVHSSLSFSFSCVSGNDIVPTYTAIVRSEWEQYSSSVPHWLLWFGSWVFLKGLHVERLVLSSHHWEMVDPLGGPRSWGWGCQPSKKIMGPWSLLFVISSQRKVNSFALLPTPRPQPWPAASSQVQKQWSARRPWLTPIILATQEAEIRRIMVQN
jgi:hypothetical protein